MRTGHICSTGWQSTFNTVEDPHMPLYLVGHVARVLGPQPAWIPQPVYALHVRDDLVPVVASRRIFCVDAPPSIVASQPGRPVAVDTTVAVGAREEGCGEHRHGRNL